MSDRHTPPAPITAISDMIASIGSDRFPDRLLGFFNSLIPVDYCRVARRHGDCASSTVLSAGSIDTSPEGCEAFAPSFVAEDVPPLQCDGPELMIGGKAPEDHFFAGLSRLSGSPFTEAEIVLVEAYTPLAVSAIRQHLASTRSLDTAPIAGLMTSERRRKLLTQIRSDLLQLCAVSPREADVCAHIAIGYNINAISMLLGISQNTASTHRKRAYAKLGISSQNELFARYIDVSPRHDHAIHAFN